MTTGKDYGLPEEYVDWEPWDGKGNKDGREYISVTIAHHYPNGWLKKNGFLHLRAPKPKPELPDVKPGAVVRFRQLDSTRTNRAVKTSRNGPWIVLADDGMNWTFTGSEMLATFDMESAAIELDGLE